MTSTTLFRLCAWLLLLGIVLATLAPLDLRPRTLMPAQAERLLAFAAMGLLLALAYPRHILVVAALVVGTAVLLEVLQLATPSRHGTLLDLAVKLVGGGFGIGGGLLALRVRARLWRQR